MSSHFLLPSSLPTENRSAPRGKNPPRFRGAVGLLAAALAFGPGLFSPPSSPAIGIASAAEQSDPNDLVFPDFARTWDEGLPLGNGMVGALVWRKDDHLRISLDRADLWDLRSMPNIGSPEWSFRWVKTQWAQNTYASAQEKFDRPYEESPAPTKIPAGAVEFDLTGFGPAVSVRLEVAQALGRVVWADGRTLETFVQADAPIGFFKFTGMKPGFRPNLRMPPYGGDTPAGAVGDSVAGQDLRRLGYDQGRVEEKPGRAVYRQKGWNGFFYEIAVAWTEDGHGGLTGVWSVTSKTSNDRGEIPASARAEAALKKGWESSRANHRLWWKAFWSRASIRVPDPVLQKQWVLETYKFGAAARRGAPPISLQAVWTADNGNLPPWKGDFHHDLNTQLSYWPCYSGNRLEDGLGFLDWLWDRRPVFKRYTRAYFGTGGLNVPGVSTLEGEPMGGWIQYSFSPTVGAWLAQHFDLHWRFSRDREFLRDRAYPWVRDVAIHLDELSERRADGRRKLPLSSSPEIYDNSRRAWFAETTNYDLGLILWTFRTAAEMALELGLTEESSKWSKIAGEWPAFAVDPKEGLMFAPGTPYRESHRHFSHLMAFHPLGLIDGANGEADRKIILDTLATLDRIGPDAWCGYSYAWLGNLKARALDGQGAAKALRTFAEAFCLPNSFHANGDQTKSGKSKFTYRPFTLEGNFAFAAGMQEMLLQSHTGVIRVFPAVPAAWRNVSFETLRAQGAFLVSAEMKNGLVRTIRVFAEKGGRLRIMNPFEGLFHVNGNVARAVKGIIEVETKPGEEILIEFEEE
jgi:alpha-L-fucosidase 2